MKCISFYIILISTSFFTIIIINVSSSAHQRIRMISEGSCETEAWSNDAENSPEITYVFKYIQIEDIYIFLIYTNKGSLGEQKRLV